MVDFEELEDFFNDADDDFSKIVTAADQKRFVNKYGKEIYERRVSRSQNGDKTLDEKFRIARGLNKPDGKIFS